MRLRNLEFAQRLLVISNGVYENYGEKDDAALISNAAFEIYKQNKGEDYNPFYKSLYLPLENYRKNFLFYAPPAASTRAVRTINFVDDTLYIGYADGKIFKKSWKNELDSLHLYYDVKDRITSACVNNDATSLAVTGSFQYIQYFDLTSDTGSTVLIGANSDFLSDNINGKTVQFNNQGDLYLRTDTALAGWEMNRQFPHL
ncbi:MAG: hypothetical protein IPP29_15700 [Bacteroidetes bacterium]|nr:hypothetical protein [Bacteroidota bacterium]